MKKEIATRKVADKTRQNILKAARKLFAADGFSATSTLAIAKAAKVNEALIFHHFGNKAKLWQAVKAHIIANLALPDLDPQPASLTLFLRSAITQRLSAYHNNPELTRLLQWQFLEPKSHKLIAGNLLAPTNWLTPIHFLQQQNHINPELQAEFIMLWLSASINSIIFDRLEIFKDPKVLADYIESLITGFQQALRA